MIHLCDSGLESLPCPLSCTRTRSRIADGLSKHYFLRQAFHGLFQQYFKLVAAARALQFLEIPGARRCFANRKEVPEWAFNERNVARRHVYSLIQILRYSFLHVGGLPRKVLFIQQ